MKDKIVKLSLEGVTVTEIARQLGISRNTVYFARRGLNLPKRYFFDSLERDKGSQRQCRRCNEWKDFLLDFRVHKNSPKGRETRCLDCEKIRKRENHLKNYHGVDEDYYDKKLIEQNYSCAICGCMPKTLCIDHCHKSGNVRGLLCHNCNRGLGMFKDSETFLRLALEYLSASK